MRLTLLAQQQRPDRWSRQDARLVTHRRSATQPRAERRRMIALAEATTTLKSIGFVHAEEVVGLEGSLEFAEIAAGGTPDVLPGDESLLSGFGGRSDSYGAPCVEVCPGQLPHACEMGCERGRPVEIEVGRELKCEVGLCSGWP